MPNATKWEMLEKLRRLLAEALDLKERGVAYAKLANLHGYIDGYMHALIAAKVASQAELLSLVAEQRQYRQGPATRELHPDIDAVA